MNVLFLQKENISKYRKLLSDIHLKVFAVIEAGALLSDFFRKGAIQRACYIELYYILHYFLDFSFKETQILRTIYDILSSKQKIKTPMRKNNGKKQCRNT